MKAMSRRSFVQQGTMLGASSLFSPFFIRCARKSGKTSVVDLKEISVIQGEDYYKNTVLAIERLGGMNRFFAPGSRVAVLANPQRNNPGAFTKPAILAATIRMCKEAGAREINCISWMPESNWENTGLLTALKDEGAGLLIADRTQETLFKPVPVPRGKALKEARILKSYFDHDVLINIPVTKDHAGNKFTGTLKNLMGINSPLSNRTFHKENWQTDPAAISHLDQCIADLNTVITPTLCIVDATEFIITNGPFGPGELCMPKKVVAGTDRVALDSYCCALWGLKADDIVMIQKAKEHGLGTSDLSKINIHSTTA